MIVENALQSASKFVMAAAFSYIIFLNSFDYTPRVRQNYCYFIQVNSPTLIYQKILNDSVIAFLLNDPVIVARKSILISNRYIFVTGDSIVFANYYIIDSLFLKVFLNIVQCFISI